MNISIVIPTFNEEENICSLLAEIHHVCLGFFDYEVIVVDDGDDGTAAIARILGARVVDGQRKGLGQAIIDGINSSQSEVVLVMDADLQHNPQDIPRLLEPIISQGCDFVIGSKYVKGGNVSEWGFFRRTVSTISGYFWYIPLGIKDANSGFFAFRKCILEGVELKPNSWKIMLEVLVKGKWVSKVEIPIKFSDREHGESKNSIKQAVILSGHMVKLMFAKYRFLRFGLVGASLAGVHFGLLFALTEYANLYYLLSAISSGIFTATVGYTLNHRWTFAKTRIRRGWFGGWLQYVFVCGLAELTYIGMLALFTEVVNIWYMVSAMMAICINYPIKYQIVSRLVWETKIKDSSDSKDFEWRAFYQANPIRRAWKRKITGNIAAFVNSKPVGTILDIGCGSSPTVAFLNHDDYLGVDKSEAKIRFMKARNIPDCGFVVGDVADLAAIKGHYDIALCIEVIEHLRNPAGCIESISAKLKPGGVLIIATPNHGSILWRTVEKAQRLIQPTHHTSRHIRLFEQVELDSLCGACGLHNIRSERIAFGMDMILYYEKD